MPEPDPQPAAALFAAMRNEGPFILEWLAYHRVIGFDLILIATNDCTDGSDTLLDALAAAGAVIHLPNPVPPGGNPQAAGIARALDWLASHDAPDWLAHLDSDEFLNIRASDGLVATLTAAAGNAHAIALAWRPFGHNGADDWPGATLPHFTACDPAPLFERIKFKSMFRRAAFAHAHDHLPDAPRVPAPRAVNARGTPLNGPNFDGTRRSRYLPFDRAVDWAAAQVNHYTRSRDIFVLKNARGDGQGKPDVKYRLNGMWHQLADGAGAEDRSILRHWPATMAEMARLRALPGVAEAEAACLTAFAAHRAATLTPARLRDWTRPVKGQ